MNKIILNIIIIGALFIVGGCKLLHRPQKHVDRFYFHFPIEIYFTDSDTSLYFEDFDKFKYLLDLSDSTCKDSIKLSMQKMFLLMENIDIMLYDGKEIKITLDGYTSKYIDSVSSIDLVNQRIDNLIKWISNFEKGKLKPYLQDSSLIIYSNVIINDSLQDNTDSCRKFISRRIDLFPEEIEKQFGKKPD